MPYQHTSGQVKCRLILALSAYLCCYGMIGGSVKALGQNTSSATSESDSGTTAVLHSDLEEEAMAERSELAWASVRLIILRLTQWRLITASARTSGLVRPRPAVL